MKKYTISLLLLLILAKLSSAQMSVGDSLVGALSLIEDDSLKVHALNTIFLEYEFTDQEKAGEYLDKAFVLANKTGYKRGLALTYYHMGFFAEDKGNYAEALKNYFASLKIREAINATVESADSYLGIGTVYYLQENYSEALKKYTASLEIFKKMEKKPSMASAYNNIGGVHYHQKDYAKALEMYAIALEIRTSLGDERGIADSHGNMGNLYSDRGNYAEALKHYLVALAIMEKSSNQAALAGAYSNIGILYTRLKEYERAKDYLLKAKKIGLEIGYKECLQNTFQGLAELDSAQNNFRGAYENHKLFILYSDSLDNEETRRKTIQNQMTYDFEKKEAVAQAEHKKELENQQTLAEEKSRKQKVVILFVALGLLLVLIFAAFIFRSLRITRKQKNTIEEQKNTVVAQKKEVEFQKYLVEEKQKEIIDSINYARRIQRSLLPTEKYIERSIERLKKS
ncbi:MAG: tetratricopeptide repeat protein [Bacteroidetes bacterium]|nr:tetratricopeptide repeat protein [Bacteroidota bacterium]